jgi:hypothetical protein
LSPAPTFLAIHKTTPLKNHYFVFSYPLSPAPIIFLSLLSTILFSLILYPQDHCLANVRHFLNHSNLPPPRNHNKPTIHFLFNLPHSSPSKSFPCQRAPIFTMKALNPHHTNQNWIDIITTKSDPPPNNRSTNSPYTANASIYQPIEFTTTN